MDAPRRWFEAAAAAAMLLLAGGALAAPAINVTGRYDVRDVEDEAAGVSLTFTADLLNQAAAPVTGQVVLRDPALADRVFASFGQVTIAPGETVRIQARNVQVPEPLFRTWSQSGAPGLYVDVENENGDVTLFRVPLTKGVAG